MTSAPAFGKRLRDCERGVVVRVARHGERHQRGAALLLEGGEAAFNAGGHRFLLSRNASTLVKILVAAAGKIDHHQMILRLGGGNLRHACQRMGRFQCRDDAFELAAQLECRHRFVIGRR